MDQLTAEKTAGELHSSVIAAFISCIFLLYVKHLATLAIQGRGGFSKRLQEDKGLVQNLVPTVADDDDSPERWNRILTNDLENIPLALIIQLGSLVTFEYYYFTESELKFTIDHEEPTQYLPVTNRYFYGHIVLTVLYMLCRYIYTICYAFKLQPFRSIVWALGNLLMFVLALMACIASYENVYNTKKIWDDVTPQGLYDA